MIIENKLYEQICKLLLKNKNKIYYTHNFLYYHNNEKYYFIYKGKEIEVYKDTKKLKLYCVTNYNLTIDNFWLRPTILLKSYENLCKYLINKAKRKIEKQKKIEEINNSCDERFNFILKKAEEEHYKRIDGNLGDNEDYECDYSKDVWLG